jgi:hypothetical protein
MQTGNIDVRPGKPYKFHNHFTHVERKMGDNDEGWELAVEGNLSAGHTEDTGRTHSTDYTRVAASAARIRAERN